MIFNFDGVWFLASGDCRLCNMIWQHLGYGDGRVQGAVVYVVRLHNEEQEMDVCLYRLSRCLDAKSTNRLIAGC